MADDFVPAFEPGRHVSYTVGTGGVTAGGLVVEVTGAYTVTVTAGASAKVAGVALFPALAGGFVTVARGGVQTLTAASAVNVGDPICSAAGGFVATFAGTNFVQVFGIALTAAAGSGLPVDVLYI
jgi:hypothetical protein